jgi:hypothetical protein
MMEKAGDLYAYLLGMDPDNQTLVELAGTFRGTGDTDVMRILGMAASAREPAASVKRAAKLPADSVVDIDKTIQVDMDRLRSQLPAQEEGDLSEMLVKTQQFDPKELGAVVAVTEEIAPESSGIDANVVTGDDITSRMAMMFGEQEPAAPAAGPEVLDQVDIDRDKANGRDQDLGIATVKGVETGVVSGSDITLRLEQLFGEEETPAVAPGADYASPIHKQESLEETVMHAPLDVAPTQEVSRDELRPVESSAISGHDIASRLNEMFDDVPPPAPLLDNLALVDEIPSPGIADTAMSPVSDVGGEAQQKSVAGAKDGEITASEGELAETLPSAQGVVSGDDVTFRLETIFDEEEEGAQPADSASVQAVSDRSPDATDVSRADETPVLADGPQYPGEDTKPPTDMGEGTIVIGDGDDTLVSASETLVAPSAGKPATEELTPRQEEPDEAPTIDDAVVLEVEETAPAMSGDDVAARMDDLFGDTLVKEGELKSAGSIPEGDKEDVVVEQGLRTKSGENTETAESDDVPSFELNKLDAAAPESDTLDLAREPEERTVLMDEEGEDTMPTEEETILSESRDPFLAAPVPGPSAADETEVRDTASGEKTETAESGDVPSFELDKLDAAAPESDTLDLAREPEERTVLMDEEGEDTMSAEEETILSGSRDPFLAAPVPGQSATDETEARDTAPVQGDVEVEASQMGSDAEQTQVSSIPDHVLTPTLADIYYQQGQSQLALQIYRRLLDADPDNERIAKRIREIETTLASQEIEETVALDASRKKSAAQVAPPVQPQPDKKRKQRFAPKPLSGVRIKKKFKNKPRKNK